MKSLLFFLAILTPSGALASNCAVLDIKNETKIFIDDTGDKQDGRLVEYKFYTETNNVEGWLDFSKGLAVYSENRFEATQVLIKFYLDQISRPDMILSYAKDPKNLKLQEHQWKSTVYGLNGASGYVTLSQDQIQGINSPSFHCDF